MRRHALAVRLCRIDVQGRADDTVRLVAPDGQSVRVLPLAISTVLEGEAGLFDFQLVQQGPRERLLRTGMRGPEARLKLLHARTILGAFLAGQGAPVVRIQCRCNEPG